MEGIWIKVARAMKRKTDYFFPTKRRSRIKPGDDEGETYYGTIPFHCIMTAVPSRGRREWRIKSAMTTASSTPTRAYHYAIPY
jgi:hypothetical protein